ncbi:MAG: hypothetical protein CSA65_02020 [Proteobacteria bacterium]|nr:MAG: hypothetical protein CSA65_02020 [Pseudomonadota bacterium]
MVVATLGLAACGPPPPPYYGGGGGGGGGSGAVRRGAKPAWVDGTPARYPQMQYLTGVGRGSVRGPCERDGRAAIAKIFEARVQAVSKDWMGHFSKVNATGKVRVEAMAVTTLTQVSTDYVVKGVKVPEVWKGGGGYHCLATLERLPAARTLQAAIDKLDVEIAAKVSQGDKAANDTAKFFAYKAAMLLMQRREALNAELRIVHPTGQGRPAPVGWADLVAKFTGVSQKIKIGLKITGRDSKKLQTCIAEQLVKNRIQVTETSNDVDLFITGAMKWQWAGYNNGSWMVKVDLNVRIMNMDNGKTVGAYAEDLKSGRPQKSQALQTTSVKLCHKAAPALVKKIMATLSR